MIEDYDMDANEKRQLRRKAAKAWEFYKQTRQLPTPKIESFVNDILEVNRVDGQMGLLIAVIYLTGSRKHEILPYKYQGTYAKELADIIKPSFMPRNMWIERDANDVETLWFVFNTRNLKQNSKSGKTKISLEQRRKLLIRDSFKRMSIPDDEDFPEHKLLKLLHDFFRMNGFYLDDLDDQISKLKPGESLIPFKQDKLNEEIFKDSGNRINVVCIKYLGKAVHNLRDIRIRHLREVYHFDASELQIAGGWKTADMALRYAKSSQYSLKSKFKEYKYASS